MKPPINHRILLLVGIIFTCTGAVPVNKVSSKTDWNKLAEAELKKVVDFVADKSRPKNIILFIGDGMGPGTLAATRGYRAQSRGLDELHSPLAWENFPITGLAKTHNADKRVPDSAATATAMFSGEKANFRTVGVNDNVQLKDCSNVQDNKLTSILEHAVMQGLSSGLVTTTRITHATPAAAYASSASRYYDYYVPDDTPGREQCPDIATQLIENTHAQHFNVILGGGRSHFIPASLGTGGKRHDNRTLINEWLENKSKMGLQSSEYAYITNRTQLDALDVSQTKYVLGLFSDSHLEYEYVRQQAPEPEEPSLAEMTSKAIQMLSVSQHGYVLVVEGGLIDRAHHDNYGRLALEETISLSETVQVAVDSTSRKDTLIVVTADHAHAFYFGGYPHMNDDILGTFMDPEGRYPIPFDEVPIPILSYQAGEGWYNNRLEEDGRPVLRENPRDPDTPIMRRNLTLVNMTDPFYRMDAGIPSIEDTHGGQEVFIHALGPSDYLFNGVHQQHYIAHALMYAACFGLYTDSQCGDLPESSGRVEEAVPATGNSLLPPPPPVQSKAVDWNAMAHEELLRTVKMTSQMTQPRNVILFVGDGMGLQHIAAARAFLSQSQHLDPITTQLAWETFSHTAVSKTHNSDRRVPDSAATATAMFCGEKTNLYTVGVTDDVTLGDCSQMREENQLKSILKHAIDDGKWSGLVTSARVTDATPAAAYAHAADRAYQYTVPDDVIDRDNCPHDLAHQLIHNEYAQQFRVIMGGGRAYLEPEPAGKRIDNQNLTQQWLAYKEAALGADSDRYRLIGSKQELDNLDTEKVDYVLGLFADEDMDYDLERQKVQPPVQPSLADMVQKSIQLLARAEHGYVLIVEGARVDHANHRNLVKMSLGDVISLSHAVERARSLTEDDQTLLVVTSDHAHSFAMGGYPSMEDDILGTFMEEEGIWAIPTDFMPLPVLSYQTGRGWYQNRLQDGVPIIRNNTRDPSTPITRRNLTDVDMTGDDYLMDSSIPSSSTHGGDDVAIYAYGPSSYLFTGVHQQHYIAHALMYASCLGPYSGDACQTPTGPPPTAGASFAENHPFITVTLLLIFVLIF